MNASICSRHEPVTLDHVKALMVAMDGLRSSPAPVVGGVKLEEKEVENAIAGNWYYGDVRVAETTENLNKLLASRLPALKPGEVEELRNLRECAKHLLDDVIDDDAGDGMNSQEIALWMIRELRAALRAQPTTTEKETGHA
jgi:hypothetical protein